ncbi:MAG: hypothetical protein AVDCRST_MAG68-5229 [uncultured Gemmatimonadetes bacterium]|uniref:DUF3667 domain-containing protein n=1 Tax=uncultured Gemmatimonadota bacterium TaxID=203437 RepID=A0A6J4MU09_9BACT|nr:MAG: hypothetical protein AVDCRST_MAG68-5229 [uncultured Gemmatimonadota bacterium]
MFPSLTRPPVKVVVPQTAAVPLCANCASLVTGPFCAQCGQRNIRRLVSVRRMMWDVLDDQLSVNSALPRTISGLLLRPGFLTREYVAGRIVRYIAPFRLYLVTSLLFFLVLALYADPRRLGQDAERGMSPAGDSTAASRTVVKQGRFLDIGPMRDTANVPRVLRPLARRLGEQEKRINSMPRAEAIKALVSGIERNAPKTVFLLLPLVAIFLKLLYYRRNRLYVEHFVFALHIHSFAYVVFTALLLTSGGPYSVLLLLWLVGYVFWAMKRVYGQGFRKTGTKYLILGGAYLFALTIGMMLTVLVTTLTV